MSLKNFSKVKLIKHNKSYWKLYDINGNEVLPFTEWNLDFQDKFSFNTRDKYTQVVSKFLDYLFEVNVYESNVTRLELKEAITNYKLLISKGQNLTDKTLQKIAMELNFNPIKPASWSNNIAAINSFLIYVFEKEEDEREYLSLKKNIHIPEKYKDVLPELKRNKTLNHFEKKAIQQKSFIANLYRVNGSINVVSGLKAHNTNSINPSFEELDFPALQIPALLSNTTCFRDRAIYSLMAGTGIRSSEAISLTWDMIDIENQKVYIQNKDPIKENEKIKFKGRDTVATFFVPELRYIFFKALYDYQLKEASNSNTHNYVFEFLSGKAKGKPYYQVSRQSFIKGFVKTVKRANIPSPRFNDKENWTPHSLRHFYGVYMLNHIPLSNGYGFNIEEVQKMLGHSSIETTQKYARRKEDYITTQLEYAELSIHENKTIKDVNELFKQNFLEVKK